MGWKIEFIQDAGIISTTVSGAVTLDEIKKIAEEVFKEAKRSEVNKLISDCRKVTLDLSTVDIHDLPQTFRELGRTPSQRSAIVYSANSLNKSDYEYFDTRCFNSSYNAKVFTDYDEAYQWLIDDTKK
jgi:hypothetical protein